MNKLITLDDVTATRATVTAIREVSASEIAPNLETGRSSITARNYAVVTDMALVPEVGERVWIDDGSTRSSGERTITARA